MALKADGIDYDDGAKRPEIQTVVKESSLTAISLFYWTRNIFVNQV